MAIEAVTKEDLQAFRSQMLDDIKEILSSTRPQSLGPWLKNADVGKLLNVSPATLQRLRISGKLHSTKIGGTHYYRYEDIEKMMNN